MRVITIIPTLFLIIFGTELTHGQKLCLDTSVCDEFPRVSNPVISDNGEFLAFDIKKGPMHGSIVKRCIQTISMDWKMDLPIGVDIVKFTGDSKYCVSKTLKDTLYIIDLKNKSMSRIPEVLDYEVPTNGSGSLITYTLKGQHDNLVVRDISKNVTNVFGGVKKYWLSPDGKTIVILNKIMIADDKTMVVKWLELNTGKQETVHVGSEADNFIVDFTHKQIAYKIANSIWYYKLGIPGSICLKEIKPTNPESEFSLNDLNYFSSDGSRLFITVSMALKKSNHLLDKMVEVWSFSDKKLQSEIPNVLPKENVYKAVIDLAEHQLIQLQRYSDEFLYKSYGILDDFFLVSHGQGGGSFGEDKWNSSCQRIFTLVDGKNGHREVLSWLNIVNKVDPKLSPNGQYITYYDSEKGDYFSYNTQAKRLVKITNNISTSWLRLGEDYPRGIAGWLSDESGFLVYDSHDIWQLDPSGEKPPLNLTNGYGIKHQVTFTLSLVQEGQLINKNKSLILSALNLLNKENGFFAISLKKSADPVQLSSGSYIYATHSYNSLHYYGFIPLKAKNKEIYIVQRMSTSDAPNYFSTSDFKTFKRLTDLQPQVNYNWYTTELHTWLVKEGESLQGILYKPENFDPGKKYPVILHFYERLSDGLNAFLEPEYSYGAMNIPSYVSNGYLVFCPDIYYTVGNPMQGTFNSVVSGGEYVANLPFVDCKKIGIQAHSFGGIQTNYLITRTGIFAAACSSSGQSDYISAYGTLSNDPTMGSMQSMYETGQQRMGSTLWENKQGYISNSPVFNIEKITTPLLMKHGKQDPVCPFANAMEFFLGLRRLGKTAWLLAYPNSAHSLHGNEAKDFTIRMQQFFDYYLKDKAAPLWMLSSVDDNTNGSELDLDTINRKPGPNLLIPEQQQKIDNLMSRNPISLVIN